MKLNKPLVYRYSGKKSKVFWKIIRRCEKNREGFYALGCALQNIEGVLLEMIKEVDTTFVVEDD